MSSAKKPRRSVFRDVLELSYNETVKYKLYKSIKGSKDWVQRLGLLKSLPVHRGCVNCICWNDKGDSILSGSDDQRLVITHAYNYKVLCNYKTSHKANIFSAKFLPYTNDSGIVSCSGDGTILYTNLYNLENSYLNVFNCHLGTTYEVATVPNDPHTFMSCGEDYTVRCFDLRVKDKCIRQSSLDVCNEDVIIGCQRAVTALTVNSVKPYQMAIGCSDSTVRLYDRRMLSPGAWNLAKPVKTFIPPAMEGKAFRITSLSFSPKGEDILASYSSEHLYLFSVQKGDPTSFTVNESVISLPPVPIESESPVAPVRRLRLRGDWSDTGPDARPQNYPPPGGASQARPTLHGTLMQRMTEVLSRMLNDPATRAALSHGGEGAFQESDQNSQPDPLPSVYREGRALTGPEDDGDIERLDVGLVDEIGESLGMDEDIDPVDRLDIEEGEESREWERCGEEMDSAESEARSLEDASSDCGQNKEVRVNEVREPADKQTEAEKDSAAKELADIYRPSCSNSCHNSEKSSGEQGEQSSASEEKGESPMEICSTSESETEHEHGRSEDEIPSTSFLAENSDNQETIKQQDMKSLNELSNMYQGFVEKTGVEPMVNLMYSDVGSTASCISVFVNKEATRRRSADSQPCGSQEEQSNSSQQEGESLQKEKPSSSQPKDKPSSSSQQVDAQKPKPVGRLFGMKKGKPFGQSSRSSLSRPSNLRRRSLHCQDSDDSDNDLEMDDSSLRSRLKAHASDQKMIESSSSLKSEETDEYCGTRNSYVKQKYVGHRNARTMIKEATFWGEEHVISGSDCGHVFMWDRETAEVVMLLEADHHVVNCVQPHPTLPLLATSGIDYDVKLWYPTHSEPSFRQDMAEELMKRNAVMLEETKDTITVPASFMIRMLACLNQIRRAGGIRHHGRRNSNSD